ncbi:uncharacterized protein N7479_003656 [Penicillium vulpinum]|uniref:uncharacterized protein n=1 Tax=Penicillium vulpinum TaxID=29845 RepID=UPI0025487A38|nr:uncharacterized protein N7479_003656 [Penicillium vulpinum]KAJ5963780.1 hypothetical protein N7479_003656 [Penicillium vulpinum]
MSSARKANLLKARILTTKPFLLQPTSRWLIRASQIDGQNHNFDNGKDIGEIVESSAKEPTETVC